jgi:hypothetical protein
MKKLFLCFTIATVIAIGANAQSGSVLVQGDFSIHNFKDASNNRSTNYNFSPMVGYQFNDKWTAGVIGSVGGSKYNPNIGPTIKSTDYSIGLFGRCTHPLGNVFSIYGQGEFTYRGRKSDNVEYNGFGAALYPAVQVNVSNGFALNFAFGGINFVTERPKGADEASNDLSISLGQQVNLGISKNFGGTRKSR